MSYKCLLLPGDGIGPEVLAQAELVLCKIAQLHKLPLEITHGLVGGVALDEYNSPCPPQTLELAAKTDAILLGAVGGPKWDRLPLQERPEKGLLTLRRKFSFFANYRPAKVYPALVAASPLRQELVQQADILILRELVGGLYFGEPRGRDGDNAYNTMSYNKAEIEPLARLAFTAAAGRRNKLCSVDKANVLEVSGLWREVVSEVAYDYPAVELSHLYIDNAAMQLIARPDSFDVVVTENLFGDILSDLAAQVVGSIGVLPSASLNATGKGLYEPVHGSAPDIAGQDKANPIAAILSVAMLLRYSFAKEQAALSIENAVTKVLDAGLRTADLVVDSSVATKDDNIRLVGCAEIGDSIVTQL